MLNEISNKIGECPISLASIIKTSLLDQPEGGFVYLLKSGLYYKVGKTTNLSKRLGQIKLQLPFPVEFIRACPTSNTTNSEKYWHEYYADSRRNGEWFELDEFDVNQFLQEAREVEERLVKCAQIRSQLKLEIFAMGSFGLTVN